MAKTVGGRVDLTINGQVYSATAEIDYEPVNIEVETVTNQDGTGGRTIKPKPFKAEIKYRDYKDLDPALLMVESFDFSMRLRDVGRSILISAAHHEGTPKINTGNGEISGLTVCGFQMQVVN